MKRLIIAAAVAACLFPSVALGSGGDAEPPSKYVKVIGKSREQCVIYVRRVTGNQKVRGWAKHLRPEGTVPKVGAAALERKYGHVSVVVAIEGDYLILHDANWKPGYVTERRVHKSTQRGYVY